MLPANQRKLDNHLLGLAYKSSKMNVSTSGSKKCKLTKNCQAYFSVFNYAVSHHHHHHHLFSFCSCWDYRETV